MNKTNLLVAFFVAAVLAGLFVGVSGNREGFIQQDVGMPLNEKGMGPYDQVSLGGVSGWATSEPASILPSGPASTAGDPNKMMFLVGNKVDTDCCPSTFNTDTGCVCLSEQDRSLMSHRGGNRA